MAMAGRIGTARVVSAAMEVVSMVRRSEEVAERAVAADGLVADGTNAAAGAAARRMRRKDFMVDVGAVVDWRWGRQIGRAHV